MARVTEAYYDRKKKEITDAALRVCNRKTVSSMTMQDVINETGLSQGAIYRYYQNIDELLADLLSRIHEDQYETVDRLNDYLNTDTEEITALRALPLTKENRVERRRLIARQVRMLHAAWAEELQTFLYPHKRIELEFLLLADNFPDRARAIFPKVRPEREIDTHILSALETEIMDGVITPKISLEEFMEYNTAVFKGILTTAISRNSLHRNRDFDESNSYDLKQRFETFAKSSMYFLGIDDQESQQANQERGIK